MDGHGEEGGVEGCAVGQANLTKSTYLVKKSHIVESFFMVSMKGEEIIILGSLIRLSSRYKKIMVSHPLL